MSKPVRLSEDVYSRLGNLSEGFETPNDVVLKILDKYEFLESYSLMNHVVLAKINVLRHENLVDSEEATILLHYDQVSVKRAIEQIIAENNDYKFTYEQKINAIVITIERK